MKGLAHSLIGILMVLVLLSSFVGADVNPFDNFNFLDYYNLTNVSYTKSANFCVGSPEWCFSAGSAINGSGSANNASSGDKYIVVTYNSGNHIVSLNETELNTTIDALDNDTTYSAGEGLNLSGTTFNHNDSSSQATVTNNYMTFIKTIQLDTYGHILSLASATINQGLNTTSSPTFVTLNTGQGPFELYGMDQDVNTTNAVIFTTLNTGQGANELYDMNQNVNTTNSPTFAGMTLNGDLSMVNNNITINGSTLSGVYPKNSNIDGTVFAIYQTNPSGSGQNIPHFWVQSGGASQASGVARSFMIVNENASVLNSSDFTSCITYMNAVGETLKIDCNTTTTGADLLVGDDAQIVGDVWIKDGEGEWHFMSREMTLRDQLSKNTVESAVNNTIDGTNFTIREHVGDFLVVNVNEVNLITTKTTDYINLTNGTNSSPQFQHIYYSGATPSLTKSLSAVDNVPDVLQALLGDGYIYGAIGGSANTEDFIRGVYHRFYDEGAIYTSGFDQTVNTTHINISTGVMKIMLDSYSEGDVLSTADFYLPYTNGTFAQGASMDDFTNYLDSGVIGNNKYFNVVCGVVRTMNSTGADTHMLCLPQSEGAAEYATLIGAELDEYNAVTYFPGNSFLKKVYIPIVRVVVRNSGGTMTIQQLTNGDYYYDIRGTVTTAGGNAPTPGVSDHSNLDSLTYAASGHTGFMADSGDTATGNYDITGYMNVTGALSGATLNTGQGAYELFAMNQDLESTDTVIFGNVQSSGWINATGALLGATIDTGEGATEVHAMDQDVETSDSVQFSTVNATKYYVGPTACIYYNASGLVLDGDGSGC